MTTTLTAVLQSARAKLATIAPSRDVAALFLEHTSNMPFEDSPVAGADGFEVVSEAMTQTSGAGLYGVREWSGRLVIKLGHSPYDTDDNREENRSDDLERVVDILEAHAWPDGTQLVLFESEAVEKGNASWWVTRLVFKLVYIGELRLS